MTPPKTTTKKTKTIDDLPELQPNPFMHEILDLASKQRNTTLKAEVLKKYRCDPLVTILIWNFDDTCKSVLPEGEVPYSKPDEQTPFDDTLSSTMNKAANDNYMPDEAVRNKHTSIRKEFQNFYNYLQGGNPGLSGLRRETMFIQMLEGLHPKEAEIMVLVKDHQLQKRYKLTLSNVQTAFPDITWGGRS